MRIDKIMCLIALIILELPSVIIIAKSILRRKDGSE